MSEEVRVKIEQAAMAYFDEKRLAKQPKMSVDALARAVFPDAPNARMIIQRMRKPQANGKTRSMSLGEFIDLAVALGISPMEAFAAVLNRVEETKI